jgi:hypothetical protein
MSSQLQRIQAGKNDIADSLGRAAAALRSIAAARGRRSELPS